jgi:hypothetical protein
MRGLVGVASKVEEESGEDGVLGKGGLVSGPSGEGLIVSEDIGGTRGDVKVCRKGLEMGGETLKHCGEFHGDRSVEDGFRSCGIV